MDSFEGKLAVVTGGGTGMGRELVLQLAAAGCSVAACDVLLENLEETARLAAAAGPTGITITTHRCDVSDEADMLRFRDEVIAQHGTDRIYPIDADALTPGPVHLTTSQRVIRAQPVPDQEPARKAIGFMSAVGVGGASSVHSGSRHRANVSITVSGR